MDVTLELSEPTRQRAWRFERIVEFLATGGVSFALLPLMWVLRAHAGLDSAELWVGFVAFYGAFVINDPHFAVTYVLFYRRFRARVAAGGRLARRYWLAGVVVPVLMAAWLAGAIAGHSAVLLGALIQVMFFLVKWHYVKQGFGVLMVLSARRGVTFSTWERRWALIHCFAAWAYAWASPADPGSRFEENGVVFTTIAHPVGLEQVCAVAFFGSAAALAVSLLNRVRAGNALPLTPVLGWLTSVWLWTVYSSSDPLFVYVIPALHSIQYWYFVTLLRRGEALENSGPPHFQSVSRRLLTLGASALLLGWVLLRALPGWLDDSLVLSDRAAVLGSTPYLAAFVTFVNLHHYFMDNVIWRRGNPEMALLTRSGQQLAATRPALGPAA